jgi:hypothetical protein
MKYLKLFEEYKVLKDTDSIKWVQDVIEYNGKKIYLYMNFIKDLKCIKVDFDNKDLSSEISSIEESVNSEQSELFKEMTQHILDYFKETGSIFIYFQAKEARTNIYDSLVDSLSGDNFNVMRLVADKLRQGKTWYFCIKKSEDTPSMRSYLKDIWERTVEQKIKNGD